MTDLGTLGGAVSFGRGINDSGQIVAERWFTSNLVQRTHAYLYSGGSATDMGTLGDTDTTGAGINNSGQVVGWARNAAGMPRAYLYSGGSMTDLGTLGGVSSKAEGINDSGQVVGEAENAAGYYRAFLYSGGSMTDLGTLGGDRSGAYGINNSGQVVGWAQNAAGYGHAFLYSGGTMTDLGTLGDVSNFSVATGINNSGQVVGYAQSYSNDYYCAFLYQAGIMKDLNTLIPNRDFSFVGGINDKGQIATRGRSASPSLGGVAYLLTPSFQMEPLRVTSANVEANNGIDDPIKPFADTSTLSTTTAPLKLGVVADGVTPVVFRCIGPAGNYKLSLESVGAYTNYQLSSRLFVLQDDQWVATNTLTLPVDYSTSKVTNYAYLQGVDWSELTPNGNAREIAIKLTASPTDQPTSTYSTTIAVRPPPLFLVHGVNSDNGTWGMQTLAILKGSRPEGFVKLVQYGIGPGTDEGNWINTYERLDVLARELDTVLLAEKRLLDADWACTRYDVVGHSQGGVLLRMLCQNWELDTSFGLLKVPRFVDKSVVHADNFYRGRFRRVITVGSPHNGSLMGWYQQKYIELNLKYASGWYTSAFDWNVAPILFDAIPVRSLPKFNPFGNQIQTINATNSPADARIKMLCLQTYIYSGLPPNSNVANNPMCYSLVGLCDQSGINQQTRGEVLLPSGSDGVVDFESEGGGYGSKTETIVESATDIAHSSGLGPLFGTWIGQTTSPRVASAIDRALRGPAEAFGPFKLPTLRTPIEEFVYTAIGPAKLANTTISPAIAQSPATSSISATAIKDAGQARYFFILDPTPPIVGSVNWMALVYSTNGVSTNGVSVLLNSNLAQATVLVDDGLVGDVVLFANYGSTNGIMVTAGPVLVVSKSQGTLTGVEVSPVTANVSTGDIVPIEVFGVYEAGLKSQVAILIGQVTFASLATNIATVSSNGIITVKASGTATINVGYAGYQATTTISGARPSIVQDPLSQSAPVGSSAPFSVAVSGSSPYTYQWRKAGVAIPSSSRFAGTTNGSFSISGVITNDAGNYDVVVANGYGSVTSLVATLSIPESIRPTVIVTAPTANQRWSNTLFTITGTAVDNMAVSSVWIRLNTNDWKAAIGTTNWNLVTALTPGTNVINAAAVDISGNCSITNSRILVYAVSAPISLSVVGKGTVSGATNGQLLEIGKNVNLTATSASGYGLTNWLVTENGVTLLSTNKAAQFLMQSNLVLTATFADVLRPTNTISAPISGQRWSNAGFTVKGTARDNTQVASVLYQLNGGAWSNALTANTWTNWTAGVVLTPGTNAVRAYAMDTTGIMSLTNSVSLQFVVTNRLLVSATGKGTLSPNYSNGWLESGRNYSIKATAGSGFAFTNWGLSTNWGGSATTNNATVQFMMQSNLTLQVNFADVTKPTNTITSPTAGQKMTNALANVKGTARDNWGIGGVQYQLNGGAWGLATSTNGWTNWAVVLPLIAGTNVIKAYALDLGGNASPTNTVSVVSSNSFMMQLVFTSALPLKTNGLAFSLQLSKGLNGRIQVSSNLNNWTTLTDFVGTNTTLNFRDPGATNSSHRFYRAVIP